VHLGAPGTLRPVLGAAFYPAAFGLFALGLGTLIRRTAGAVATLIAVLIFLPAAAGALPTTWRDDVNRYLPSVAGQAVIRPTDESGRRALLRKGFALEHATLGWNVAGIVVLAVAAVTARSVALAGFGLDSLLGITWTAVTAAVMFALAAGKARTGRELDNPS
jgi:hypothetical protein